MSTKTKSETLRILQDTNKLLANSNKWCKGGVGRTKNGRRCLGSALYAVACEKVNAQNTKEQINEVARTAFNLVNEAIKKHPDGKTLRPYPTTFKTEFCTTLTHSGIIVEFNDHSKTTFADIKKVLKTAISLQRSK